MSKEELLKEQEALSARTTEIRNELHRIAEAEKMMYVGRCFRFNNRYDEGPWWFEYQRVTGIDQNGCMWACKFFHDKQGVYKFDTHVHIPYGTSVFKQILGTEITLEEYRKAFSEMHTGLLTFGDL